MSLLCNLFKSWRDNLLPCQRINQNGASFLQICKFCQVTQYRDLKRNGRKKRWLSMLSNHHSVPSGMIPVVSFFLYYLYQVLWYFNVCKVAQWGLSTIQLQTTALDKRKMFKILTNDRSQHILWVLFCNCLAFLLILQMNISESISESGMQSRSKKKPGNLKQRPMYCFLNTQLPLNLPPQPSLFPIPSSLNKSLCDLHSCYGFFCNFQLPWGKLVDSSFTLQGMVSTRIQPLLRPCHHVWHPLTSECAFTCYYKLKFRLR